MSIMTGAEYIDSIKRMKPTVYAMGEKIEDITEHPFLKPACDATAKYFDFTLNPKYKDRITSISTIASGELIAECARLYTSKEYLVERFRFGRELRRVFGIRGGGVADSVNALWSSTYDCDKKYGTEYHGRFQEFLKNVHKKSLICSITASDVKGDRSKRPVEQSDPDMYVHKIETRKDGIIVRGCKAHQSNSIHSHEIVCITGRRMQQDEKDYAVAFAVPTNTKGVIQICSRQPSDTRRLEGMEMDWGFPQFGGTEALVIFNDVFVPWERVFLNGEWDFTPQLMETFANFHRVLYALKSSLGDLIIGAAVQIAEYNGVAAASHIRSKVADMIILNETMYCCGLAAASQGIQTPSGVWCDDPVLSNVVKGNVVKNMYEIGRLAEDIAGGLLTTQPSEKDWRNPETRPFIEKYLKAKDGVPTENRMRIFKLLECLTYGPVATYTRLEAMHGAGAPEAQKVFIRRYFDIEPYKKYARQACRLEKFEWES